VTRVQCELPPQGSAMDDASQANRTLLQQLGVQLAKDNLEALALFA
jgi:hypothetical protein